MRLRLPLPEPLLGRGKSTKLSPSVADKELDLSAFIRMRAVASIRPISESLASGVMRSGERGFGRSSGDLQQKPYVFGRI